MPKLFDIFGYKVFFWSNEGTPLEPVHIHVGKQISKNSTKIWINSDGHAELAGPSEIPPKMLNKIIKIMELYHDEIIETWERYFGVKAEFHDGYLINDYEDELE